MEIIKKFFAFLISMTILLLALAFSNSPCTQAAENDNSQLMKIAKDIAAPLRSYFDYYSKPNNYSS